MSLSESDYIGKTYGNYTIICFSGYRKTSRLVYCKCVCGEIRTVELSSLKNGRSKSCGCWQRESMSSFPRRMKHGLSKTPEHIVWCHIKGRCFNLKNKAYSRYGGRGIKMHHSWINDFTKFLEDMGRRPSRYHTIDRINVNGHYYPNNCRWATWKEQQRNRRNSFIVKIKGHKMHLNEAIEKFGRAPYGTIRTRIYNMGWPILKALKTPSRKIRRSHGRL